MDYLVSSGVTGLSVGSGDTITVYSGGVATSTSVFNGGSMLIGSSGSAIATSVLSGGSMYIYSAGSATGTIVQAGGELDVNSGGVGTNSIILSGGLEETDLLGGEIDGSIVSFGGESDVDGGVASGVVLRGGTQDVNNGAAVGTQVSAGGILEMAPQYYFGNEVATSASAIISSGGTEIANTLIGTETEYNPDGSVALTLIRTGSSVIYRFSSYVESGVNFSGSVISYTQDGTTVDEVDTAPSQPTVTATHDSSTINISAVSVDTIVQSGGVFIAQGAVIQNLTVQSGGTEVIGGFVTVSGYRLIESGITVSGNLVSNGESEIVRAGGLAFAGTVQSGGLEALSSGGVSSDTLLPTGGSEIVSSGGTAIDLYVKGGVLAVSSGGTSLDTIISSGGTEIVSAGGLDVLTKTSLPAGATATGTVILQTSGAQVISGGGKAVGTIMSGGIQYISSGGVADDAVVSSGGRQAVYSGGSAFDTTVLSGAAFYFIGGEVTNLTVSSGGSVVVQGVTPQAGTTGSGIMVSNGAALFVQAGGIATQAQIKSGGVEYVNSGGGDTNAAISSGGSMVIDSGGTAVTAVVSSGGTQITTSSGTGRGTIVESGGTARVVQTDAFDTAAVIFSGGLLLVGAAAGANGTALSGGEMIVLSAGDGGFENVSSGGAMIVASGGTGDNSNIFNSGVLVVQSGGSGAAITISNGGTYEVAGSDSSSTISAGGTATIYAGATEHTDTAVGGGVLTLVSGAIGIGTNVNTSGIVFDSGADIAETISGPNAIEAVYSGAVTSRATITHGGDEIVSGGGSAISGAVNADGVLSVVSGGSALAILVNSRGALFEAAGALASGTIVSGVSATQIVNAGAVASATSVLAGGQFSIFGTATVADISGGGVALVGSGGSAASSTVEAAGRLSVAGLATLVTVESGGLLEVGAGGEVVSATVQFGGTAAVLSGGTTSRLVVQGGGLLEGQNQAVNIAPEIQAGGQAIIGPSDPTISAHIEAGGLLVVLSGGEVDSTIVDSGGYLLEQPGAVAPNISAAPGANVVTSDVIIDLPGGSVQTYSAPLSGVALASGAAAYVLQSGVFVSGDIETGATAYVYQGGAIAAPTISGGSLSVGPGAAVSGAVDFSGTGGQLILQAAESFSATLSGFGAGDAIDLADIAFVSSATTTLSANGTLAVTQGGESAALPFAGEADGLYFHLTQDNASGTEITVDGTPCYCRGTMIRTDRGEVAIEALVIGDLVATHADALRPIRWIGRRSYSGRFATGNRDVLPVRIRADALEDGVPRRDLFVSPLHALHLDEVLIPAACLVNGVSIVQVEAVECVEYFHIELESHDIIFAEGAAAESFVDDGSRGMFFNATDYWRLHPEEMRGPARFCAPRLEDGYRVEAIRRRLATRAKPVPSGEPAPPGPLLGRVDVVDRERVSGWACDADQPDQPVRLRIFADGFAVADVLADRYRPDLAEARIGTGYHGFQLVLPNSLPGLVDHLIEIRRAPDGEMLPGSPCTVAAAQAEGPLLEKPTRFAARGRVDVVTSTRIAGWAQDAAEPDRPVDVLVFRNGERIALVLANRYRPDLQRAGIGDGRHSFDISIAGELTPGVRHVIHVRHARDDTDFPGSPAVIEADGRVHATRRDVDQAMTG
jgi:autotransporter passenger strand-loop-strand repeat protein